jgi:hypothetical protein
VIVVFDDETINGKVGSRVTGGTTLATGGPSTGDGRKNDGKEGQQGDKWHNDSDGRHDDGIREQG